MPKRKSHIRRRMQNFQTRQGVRPVATPELDSQLWSNDPIAGSEPLSDYESQPVALSSKLTLDDICTAHAPTQSHQTGESPNTIVEGLDGLTIGVAQDNEIVLEDPPDDAEDPVDNRNPPSLSDPEGNERLNLPSRSVTPNSEESKDSTNTRKQSKSSNRLAIPLSNINAMLCQLRSIIDTSWHSHGKSRRSTLGDVVLVRLQFMVGTLNLMAIKGLKLTPASLTAAVVFGRGPRAARQVCKWIRAFQKDNVLPTNVYGTWNGSVIEDKDLSAAIQHWLRDKGKYVQARNVIDFFGTEAAMRFSHLIDAPPLLRTAQRWMYRMGFTWMKEKRGQFADGHERDDVQDYQRNFYVPEWAKLERRMRSGDSEGNKIPPTLAEGERVVVVWFHDESTFYAHDRRLTRWVHESKTAGIYKKGEGLSLMVADFISADYGWLRSAPGAPSLPPIAPVAGIPEGMLGNPNNAQVIFRTGKQRNGWFGTHHVIAQLSRAMSIIKNQYPNKDHVFIYDNATIHTKLPETSANVSKMTLGLLKKVGGEEIGPSGQKIGVDYTPAILPDGTTQQLYHPLDHPIAKL